MPRMVAIAVWTAALAAFLFYLHALGKGPFASLPARHLREMKDRLAPPDSAETITHAGMLALPKGLSVAEYSGIERRAVTIEGRVGAMLRATDGDFHVELDPPPGDSLRPDVHRVTTEVTPGWHGDAADGWGFERLLAGFRPDAGGVTPWPDGPARVRLTGWLLYDHESDVIPRLLGRPLVKRATDWEIHPVTKIERWDDALATWVEVKR